MSANSFKFQCPHCEQRIGCESVMAGREIQCPGCEQPLIIPEPPTTDARPEVNTATPSIRAVRPRDWLSQIVLGAMLGALAGSLISLLLNPPTFQHVDEDWQGSPDPVLEWIHALCYRTVLSLWGVVGAVTGGVWARQRFVKRLALAAPETAPEELLAAQFNFCAPASFAISSGSWLIGILTWCWVVAQPPEAFHDQGGMVITLCVIPVTLFAWIVGGPVALAFGHRGLRRARPNKPHDHWLASTGILLSRLMLWGGVALLCLMLWRCRR